MEQEHKNLKPLLIAAVAAVTVIAILLVFFFSGRSREAAQPIVLPDPPAQEQTQEPEPPEGASLVSVSRDNVQSILEKSVARPQSYHQSMQITLVSGDTQRTQDVELWVKGGLFKVELTDAFETKTVLADENTVWLWYDEEQPVQLSRAPGLTVDDLAGVATYERILSYDKSQIDQASFVSLDDLAADCVYVSAREDDGSQQDYWVSLESGLLCKYMMLINDELIYAMEQTQLEVFPENDEALEGVFCLPDGTEAFSTEA